MSDDDRALPKAGEDESPTWTRVRFNSNALVEHRGRNGTILSFKGGEVLIRLDDTGEERWCHPNWYELSPADTKPAHACEWDVREHETEGVWFVQGPWRNTYAEAQRDLHGLRTAEATTADRAEVSRLRIALAEIASGFCESTPGVMAERALMTDEQRRAFDAARALPTKGSTK